MTKKERIFDLEQRIIALQADKEELIKRNQHLVKKYQRLKVMTKKEKYFVDELKRQQAAGNLKPSQLKRSKSMDDLPQAANQSNNSALTKCEQELNNTKKELALAHSQLTPLSKLTQKQDLQIQALTEQITRIKQETDQQLKPVAELKEDLKQEIQVKQTLTKELKEKDEKIKELTQELDKSLEKRLANLKEPNNQQESSQLQQELNQAKRKISLLESTLRLQKYNNSYLDSET
jgi:chromosome segregation ATPase